jgi:diguanylate cyclase (GGDEF)-like protein
MRMKLRAKLILILLPSIAVPLIAFGSFAFSQQYRSVERDALREVDTLSEQIGRYVDAQLEAARADVFLFSNSRILQDYVLIEDEAQRYELYQPSVLKLLSSYQVANPEYYEIRILLPDGYEDTRVTRTDIPNVTDEEGETDFFRTLAAAEDDLLTQLVHSPDTGEPALLLSKRILLVDDTADPILAAPSLRAYLLVTMSLGFLADQVRDAKIGHGGQVDVVDAGGRVIFSSARNHHHGDDPAGFSDELRGLTASDGISRVRHLGETDFARGRELHPGLFLYVALPESSLLAETRPLTLAAGILIAGSVLLTATLLYGVLRSLLLEPLLRLGQAARDVGSGKLVTDLGIVRSDEIGELATSFEEMSRNLKQSHEQIAYLAYHDSLTGLANRRMFSDELERSALNARRSGATLGLLFVDIDDFKRVNDLLGHLAGDELLREIADRLSAVVRPYDTVARPKVPGLRNALARVGGDEFLILIPDLTDPLQAATVAERILERLQLPVEVAGQEVEVTASIGITTCPQDSDEPEQLLRNSDIAMYQAKQKGKCQYCFYTEEMNAAMTARVEMEIALKKAIQGDELSLLYQPQVDAATGEIVATEALVRWQSRDLGSVMPNEFIPIAEESGLIVDLGDWVLREACRQNKAWQDAGLAPVPVAVNISNRQFAADDLEARVAEALTETGLEPRYLDIELTETSIMKSPVKAAHTLEALKVLGVQISMDDFGTGYSSLSALKRLPIDCLKIDQSFIRDISADSNDAAIVNTIIVMGKSLNLLVLAEGVEDRDELVFLREHGCDRIQGYLVSRPMPADEMGALFATGPPVFADNDKPV